MVDLCSWSQNPWSEKKILGREVPHPRLNDKSFDRKWGRKFVRLVTHVPAAMPPLQDAASSFLGIGYLRPSTLLPRNRCPASPFLPRLATLNYCANALAADGAAALAPTLDPERLLPRVQCASPYQRPLWSRPHSPCYAGALSPGSRWRSPSRPSHASGSLTCTTTSAAPRARALAAALPALPGP